MVLQKTLESPLDCKEIKPVNSKGNQSWIFIGTTDADAEAPTLWPPDKNWLIGKYSDAVKIEGRKRRGWQRMRWLNGIHWLHGLQHARLPCPSQFPRDCSNSCPFSRWCYPTISLSVVPFSSCPQSLPASGSFPMSQFFASVGQSIRASASASVLPMNIQDWFPLELTGLISLQSKGLSRVFSNTTVQKQQFFSVKPSLWSNSHPYITTGKTMSSIIRTFVSKVISLCWE